MSGRDVPNRHNCQTTGKCVAQTCDGAGAAFASVASASVSSRNLHSPDARDVTGNGAGSSLSKGLLGSGRGADLARTSCAKPPVWDSAPDSRDFARNGARSAASSPHFRVPGVRITSKQRGEGASPLHV